MWIRAILQKKPCCLSKQYLYEGLCWQGCTVYWMSYRAERDETRKQTPRGWMSVFIQALDKCGPLRKEQNDIIPENSFPGQILLLYTQLSIISGHTHLTPFIFQMHTFYDCLVPKYLLLQLQSTLVSTWEYELFILIFAVFFNKNILGIFILSEFQMVVCLMVIVLRF